MYLYRVVLVLEYKYKKTYLVVAESAGEAKVIAEAHYINKKLGVMYAPKVIDIRVKEYEIKKGVLNVRSRYL